MSVKRIYQEGYHTSYLLLKCDLVAQPYFDDAEHFEDRMKSNT